MHHLVEARDRAKEHRSAETLDIYVLLHLLGHAALIAPGHSPVKLLFQCDTGILMLYQVSGTHHEEEAGYHHAYAYSGEQIHEYRHQEYHNEHKGIGLGDVGQVTEAAEVYDAPSHGDEDACQHCQRHVLDQRAEAEEDGKEQNGMNHTRDLRASTALHIDNGTHRGTST